MYACRLGLFYSYTRTGDRKISFCLRTIQQRTGRDLGATFLSGTTISNSLTELYLSLIHISRKQPLKNPNHHASNYRRKTLGGA